jgi:hypothetical protein
MKTLYKWIGNRAFDPTMLTRPKLSLNLAAEDLVIISSFLKTRLSLSVNCDILSDVSCWCVQELMHPNAKRRPLADDLLKHPIFCRRTLGMNLSDEITALT